jgi:hypothetical protein
MVEPAGVEPASKAAIPRHLRACPPDDAQPGPEARPAVGVRHILTHVSRPLRPRRLDARDYPGRDAPASRAQAPLEADERGQAASRSSLEKGWLALPLVSRCFTRFRVPRRAVSACTTLSNPFRPQDVKDGRHVTRCWTSSSCHPSATATADRSLQPCSELIADS